MHKVRPNVAFGSKWSGMGIAAGKINILRNACAHAITHPSFITRSFVVHINVQNPDNNNNYNFTSWNTNQRTLPAPNPLNFLHAPHICLDDMFKRKTALWYLPMLVIPTQWTRGFTTFTSWPISTRLIRGWQKGITRTDYSGGYDESLRHVRCYAKRFFTNLPERNGTNELLLARQAFDSLAKRGRTWRRLGHVVDLAISSNSDEQLDVPLRSVTDVGCDHGLLTMALALSGKRFDKVIGVDSSTHALEDGAISLQQEVLNYVQGNRFENEDDFILSLGEFRVGNGLSVVSHGEADIVCIAGMGIHSIMKILGSTSREGSFDLDQVGCRKVVVQPTNSRPRDLMKLYRMLEANGWNLSEERIEKLSSRWYVTSSFVKFDILDDAVSSHIKERFPGSKLAKLESTSPLRIIFEEYLEHHAAWVLDDAQKSGGTVDTDDITWMEHYGRNRFIKS